MDNSIVSMEERYWISDSAASASKLGSLIHINSIAIDISTTAMDEMKAPTHEHFSIRGFVSGMRKKNSKTCLPFASEDNDADQMDYLPPLLVPRFRWWQCSNCVPDITLKSTKELMVVDSGRSDVAASSCQNVGEKTGVFLHSMEDIGNKLGLIDNSNEREKYPGSKEKINVTDKDIGSPHGITEANPLQISERLNTTMDDSSRMERVAEHPSGINDNPGNPSSGTDCTFNALPHRRKPKLRSLADIMVDEKNPNGDNPKARFVSSDKVQNKSTEMETVLGPQVELDVLERKRKIAQEEDREPLELVFPSSVKRIRGLTTQDVEKKCRRVEISDTESEEDASMRLDLQLGAKAQRTNLKKRNKALDIYQKMKQTSTENGTVPSVKCIANLQKHAVSQETSFGELGEMGAYFRSILSGQELWRMSNVTNRTLEVGGYDDNTVMPTSKSISGDCNIKGKVALDLSLNSYRGAKGNSNSEGSFVQQRGIPDLNLEFSQNTTVAHEKRNLPLHKTLFFQDGSASSRKEIARQGKNKLGIATPPKKDSNMELGAADDIPMEIVELLAKNQHERALGNSTRHINNSPTGYRALYVDEHPNTINFPPVNRRSGFTAANRTMRFGQNNISPSYPQFRKGQLDKTKPEDSSQFRIFTSSTPSQQRKTQFSTPNSAKNVPPFCLSIPHNHSIRPNSMGVNLLSGQRHKGKTICDSKDGQDKRSMLKDGRDFSGSTSIGYLDRYSNDTIPAMLLLSLMDQQIVSGSSFELGIKRFIDKPFSPCTDHHARLNGKENHNLPSGSLFHQNNDEKGFSGLRNGVHSSGESSKKTSSYLQGQVTLKLGNSKANPLKASSHLATRPANSNLALGVCTLNRNPADFSIPDARNEFTISAKDLKPRKSNTSKENNCLVNGKKRERQRMKKDREKMLKRISDDHNELRIS